MADEATDTSQAGTSKLRPMIMVGGMLVVEAALIIGAMMFVGRGADSASAGGPIVDPVEVEANKIVELPVLAAKLPNAKTGVTYLYDTEIHVQVRQKDSARVSAEFEQFHNEIKAEITAIWRTSEPEHFQEPKLETLTRKVKAMLHERFGNDDEGEAVLSKCIIVMGTGFRVIS